MKISDRKIGLFTKDNVYCDIAKNVIKHNFSNYRIIKGNLEDQNESIYQTKFDYIIAFLYHKIIPETILKNARIAAINFHPAPTNYPGGGYSFALYNGDNNFGTTCHHMEKKADTGKVILEKKFPLYQTDTFVTLKERTMIYTLINYFEITHLILEKKDLPESKNQWKREPLTHKDLESQVLELTLDMPVEEIDKRLRAANPDYPGPFIEINGKRYTLRPEKYLKSFVFGK